MLGGDEQEGVGRLNLGFEAGDLFRHGLLIILVIERQVVDLDEFGVEGVGTQFGQRLRQPAIDGLAPVRADDDAELVLCHGNPYLFVVTNEYQG